MSMFRKPYTCLAVAAFAGMITTAAWAQNASPGNSGSNSDSQINSSASSTAGGQQSNTDRDQLNRSNSTTKDAGDGDYYGSDTTTDHTNIDSPNSVMSGTDRDQDLNRGSNRENDRKTSRNHDISGSSDSMGSHSDMNSDRMNRSVTRSNMRGRRGNYNVGPGAFDPMNEVRLVRKPEFGRRSSTGMRNADREGSGREGSTRTGMRSSQRGSAAGSSARDSDVVTGNKTASPGEAAGTTGGASTGSPGANSSGGVGGTGDAGETIGGAGEATGGANGSTSGAAGGATGTKSSAGSGASKGSAGAGTSEGSSGSGGR